jgi:hypothetical protein
MPWEPKQTNENAVIGAAGAMERMVELFGEKEPA